MINQSLDHSINHSKIKQSPILNELLRCTNNLVQDQYGNYVIQHVLERGKPEDKEAIINSMRGQILAMSQHKFASNVVEKCVQYGTLHDRKWIIEEIFGPAGSDGSALFSMMKDQYANYVIQKIIDTADEIQREDIIVRIRPHIPQLKKFTYGKHIITKIEKYGKL